VGLGKTHLIHAIGNSIYTANPTMEIRYVHAEDYFSDMVKAFQQNSLDEFKQYYRSLDLLLIDDIQFFNRKDRTQEEFFYDFNELIGAKKQINNTSDT
jgi:chromosomal replication initiator protein